MSKKHKDTLCRRRIGSEIQKMNDLQYCDIAIVKMEIESWYLAGLSRDFCQALAIKKVEDTTGICKEKFE